MDSNRPKGYDAWAKKLRGAAHQYRRSAWAIGDLLNEGERRFGEVYAQAAEETGLATQTLMNCKWVASAIKTSWRQETLSFSTHLEIARLPDELRQKTLEMAAKREWNSSDLRVRVSAHKHGDDKALQLSWQPPAPEPAAPPPPTRAATNDVAAGGEYVAGFSLEARIADLVFTFIRLIRGTAWQDVIDRLGEDRRDQFDADLTALKAWVADLPSK